MQLDHIRYNPEICGFEALARFHEAGQVISYPVFIAAPLNADYRLILRGLAQKGHAAHRAPQKGLVMRRPETAAAPVAHGARRLLERLIGSCAAA